MSEAQSLKWFHWRQNNSNGEWLLPAMMVAVQATDRDIAMLHARKLGVDDEAPFCSCCGERWSLEYVHEADDLDIDMGQSFYDYSGRAKAEGIPLAIVMFADGTLEKRSEP